MVTSFVWLSSAFGAHLLRKLSLLIQFRYRHCSKPVGEVDTCVDAGEKRRHFCRSRSVPQRHGGKIQTETYDPEHHRLCGEPEAMACPSTGITTKSEEVGFTIAGSMNS